MQVSSPLTHTVSLGQTKQIWVKTVINAKYLLEIWLEFNVFSCLSQVLLFFAFLFSHASLFEELSQIKKFLLGIYVLWDSAGSHHLLSVSHFQSDSSSLW